MRLKQVKLAGFKSFCDPTTFELPSQLVGIVGPNGCGKSNIIDATRWVLGESRATELRGESMQDVIFNGSLERKPSSRASVELVFDNSLGRIGGAWGGFAEISVKRVLTREGQSTYYINQQAVRRKDVHDIFLGTGLGPRAYAIIGQGTISRIIEAKPDELRVFFEEAAGVSKYKERRRETENRLADTRENLTRVEDILRELHGQISKLDAQAEVAGRYRAMEAERTQKQQWLWLIKRDDAQAEQQLLEKTAKSLDLEIEGLQTGLRSAENRMETLREAVHQANDEVSRCQAAYYEVNSEISTLESQIRMIAQNRNQAQARLKSLEEQIQSARALSEGGLQRRQEVEAQLEEAREQQATAEMALAEAEEQLAACEDEERERREALESARQAAHTAQQALQVGRVERRSHEEALAQMQERRQRLQASLSQLGDDASDQLERLALELGAAQEEEARTAEQQQTLEARLAEVQAERGPAQEALQAAVTKTTTIEARMAVLEQLQARMQGENQMRPWLEKHGLGEDTERIWQYIRIEPGWETAVEAVLRERVHALEAKSVQQVAAMLQEAPPGKVGLFLTDLPAGAPPLPARPAGRLVPLASLVRCQDARLKPIMAEWLDGFFSAESTEAAFAGRGQLPPGGRFVVREGHAIGRFDVVLFAMDSEGEGVLARQQELQNLERELRAQQLLGDEARQQAERIDAMATQLAEQVRAARDASARAVRRVSTATIEHERLAQAVRSREESRQRLSEEIEELALRQAGREEALQALVDGLAEAEEKAEVASEELAAAREAAEMLETTLSSRRDHARESELAVRESAYAVRSLEQEIDNLHERIARADEQLAQADGNRERLLADLEGMSDEALREQLEVMLERRMEAEQALSEARGLADERSGELRRLDEERLRAERGQEPLRQRLIELRMKEQAARLTAEQMGEALAEASADLAELKASLAALPQRPKPSWLQSEVSRLAQAVARLGPVNLAALDELTAAREREVFLNTQSTDLQEAMATLENAIRTIDQETRSLLQSTYDTVNAEFGRLFPMLFGGGEARLVLTGGEILDAGVQVFAQPPGKKNASIHLLSGGEKALTAIALVFGIFKLNPAPFCLLDEVDAPLDDANTERYAKMVSAMSEETQFVFISHNKIAMEMAHQLIGVTMQEKGVSRLVAVDLTSAVELAEAA
ncbi:chromosome segregation protein SMC [Lautropia mirabilis]|uniref:chromosome segregation protein SMC n=1 Tax=Lautropia mirabilis TaxID=47671 RepID=UPI0028D86A47|nr:chromosome segregation protein SMC [Lautropia mirabilis]